MSQGEVYLESQILFPLRHDNAVRFLEISLQEPFQLANEYAHQVWTIRRSDARVSEPAVRATDVPGKPGDFFDVFGETSVG